MPGLMQAVSLMLWALVLTAAAPLATWIFECAAALSGAREESASDRRTAAHGNDSDSGSQ